MGWFGGMLAAAAFACVGMPAVATGAIDRPPKKLIDLLRNEAQLIRDGVVTPRYDATWAARLRKPLDGAGLLEAITRRQDPDPFIDVFVRWQLAGAIADPPALDDAGFRLLLRNLPREVPNPLSESGLIGRLERATAEGPMRPSKRRRLKEAFDIAVAGATRAAELNDVVRRFEAFVEARLLDTPERRLLWRVGRLASAAHAGWPVSARKRVLTQAASSRPSTDGEPPKTLLRLVESLVGLERRRASEVTFLADGSARVTFATSRITRADVEGWMTGLNTP